MKKLANQFIVNYVLMFFISLLVALLAFLVMDFATHVIESTLVKNNFTADKLMEDDYTQIDVGPILENNGGVQVVNQDYEVVFTAGLNNLGKDRLSAAEFTDFLSSTRSLGIPYSYSIAYNSTQDFWLIVTFPTSIRIDFSIVYNKEYASVDKQKVIGVLVAIIIFYLLLLALSTVIYSKITSLSIVNPLRKFSKSAQYIRDGDYSARVDLKLKNEFAELQDIFNGMAQKIEQEIALRKNSEENRKRLILDISHDLKNPLTSIVGYAEHCLYHPDLPAEERKIYLKIIQENGERANKLIRDLFELSRMESTEFVLDKTKIDFCEFLRAEIIKVIPILEKAGFTYDFHIPETELFALVDVGRMERVFHNILDNTLQYNPQGTHLVINLWEQEDSLIVSFKDDGVGIPAHVAQNIFQPFVRGDLSRNSRTGGTGLGLAIVHKIITAHDGQISLKTASQQGCEFTIIIPKI